MQRNVPGSAGLVLARNVVHLDPAPTVFEAMLHGWATQQRARFIRDSTVLPRERLMRRLVEFSNLYLWQWTPAEGEAFIVHLRGGEKPLALSTARVLDLRPAVLSVPDRCLVSLGPGVPGPVRRDAPAGVP